MSTRRANPPPSRRSRDENAKQPVGPVFADKSHVPADAELADVLGRAKRHWDRLIAQARAGGAAGLQWKFYASKSGWTLVAPGKRHNLLYLTPQKQRFLVAFAFNEQATQAALASDLPAEVIEAVRAAPVYAEGRAVRMLVATARQAESAGRLLACKLGS